MTSRPRIEGFRVRAVRVPMVEPHRTASGVVVESPLVLIDAMVEGGVTGHGIAFTYTSAALKPLADLIVNLEPLVKGQALAPVEIADALAARFRLLGTHGLVGMALAGIDMALWDAEARLHGVSLARLLGSVEKPLEAYGAVGYDGPRDSALVAERWAKRGFRGVKAKIGYPDVRGDIEVVKAIRAAVGPDVAIMVDYNQSLTAAEAIVRIRAIEEFGLTWVEEPVGSHDFEGHAKVAREIATPIQCGENWWGPLDVLHALRAGASDFVMLEAMKTGGVTGWRRAAALAETHAVRVSSHLWTEVSAQLLSATPMAHWLEYCDWWNPVVKHPLAVENGKGLTSVAPGSGVEWNEEAVARFAA